TTSNCTQPVGYVSNSLDCDDTRNFVYPGAPEICFNNIDDDCDGIKSEGCQPVASSLTAAYPNNLVLGSISTTILATIPTVSGGFPITGYVFEITNMTSNQTVTLPRSINKFNLTMTNIYAYDTPFAIRVKVIVNGEEQPYLGDTRVIRTPALASPSLVTTQCSQSLPIGTTIVSASVTGATDYEFTITSPTFTSPSSQVITRQVNNFRLSMMPNYTPAYNTVYNISVRARVAGAWSTSPSTCTITTLGVPTTSLVASQCNVEIPGLSTTLTATNVAYATEYKFKVSKVAEPEVEEEVSVVGQPLLLLTNLTTVAADYETDYNVWVKAGSTVNGITTWGDYAAVPCVVTTPLTPTVRIVGLAGDCETGYTPASLSTVITSETYPSARYRFYLKGYDLSTNLIYDHYVDRNTNDVTLAMFPAIPSGLDYYISVAVKLGPAVVIPKEECLIFIPTPPSRVTALPLEVTAYPNPFAGSFSLAVTTSSQSSIDIKVYDMVGRLVEQRVVRASAVESTTIGDRYPSGVYNVVVTQDEEVQTVRVVKR
ncbi:T9SS type A sorting domain-containing protein, partial [Flavobacterium sedimenticola]